MEQHLVRITDGEIDAVSRAFAEIFSDYAAYGLFFKRDDRWLEKIAAFYRYEVFLSADYTYRSDDWLCFASVKRPGDADRSAKKLWRNPAFIVPYFLTTGIRANRLAAEYIEFSEAVSAKYYDPATDCYVRNVGVLPAARGQGRLRAVLEDLCGGAATYLETHDPLNVAIYEHLGFTTVETAAFHGYTHYAMRREARCVNEK